MCPDFKNIRYMAYNAPPRPTSVSNVIKYELVPEPHQLRCILYHTLFNNGHLIGTVCITVQQVEQYLSTFLYIHTISSIHQCSITCEMPHFLKIEPGQAKTTLQEHIILFKFNFYFKCDWSNWGALSLLKSISSDDTCVS